MIGRTRVGFKYFVWGMMLGIVFAPRSGKETRAKVFNKLGDAVGAVLGMI